MNYTLGFALGRRVVGALCLPLAVAACVGSPDADEIAAADVSPAGTAGVAATAQALVSDSLPDSISLPVQAGGPAQRVFTPHGFLFTMAVTNTTGASNLGNDTQFLIVADVTILLKCKTSTGGFDYPQASTHLTVLNGKTKLTSLSCKPGETAVEAAAFYANINSDAPDVGYPGSGCSSPGVGLGSTTDNRGATNGTVVLCSGLTFRSKRRTTWGSAEFSNNGTTNVTVQLLFEHVWCSGGADFIKQWGPSTLAPGQVMTATAGCPSGQTVTTTTASFMR